jgi:hypothetical protein
MITSLLYTDCSTGSGHCNQVHAVIEYVLWCRPLRDWHRLPMSSMRCDFAAELALRAEGPHSNSSVVLHAAGDRPDARGLTL